MAQADNAQTGNDASRDSVPAAKALGLGSRGEAVRALQLRLQRSNYYEGPVDSIYGLATQRAVSAFQADVGLETTGSLNEETWARLEAVSDAGQASAPADSEGSVPENGSDTPTTAPTASELPPTTDENDTPGNAAPSEGNAEGGFGFGKVLGLGLGLAAIAASFGVGFFIANRGKPEEDEDDWAESGAAVGSASGIAYNGLGSVSTNGNRAVSSNGMQSAAAVQASTVATPINNLASTSGQMGGTAPLAQVEVIDGLLGDLRSSDPSSRRKAIWELGQRGNSLAMQPLVDAMVDADSKEKSLVLAALSEIGQRSLRPMNRALAIALQDDNPEVRKNAIRDLTRVYDLVVQISQMLGHATEDEDPDVRQTATWALDKLNRIRRTQDLDANIRTLASGNNGPSAPIDLLSSEASMRRSSQ